MGVDPLKKFSRKKFSTEATTPRLTRPRNLCEAHTPDRPMPTHEPVDPSPMPDELAADALDGPDARDAANLQALLRILLEMPAPVCFAFWRMFWIEPKAPSASTIAALSGTAKRTVQRRLAELRRVHADHLFAVARGEG